MDVHVELVCFWKRGQGTMRSSSARSASFASGMVSFVAQPIDQLCDLVAIGQRHLRVNTDRIGIGGFGELGLQDALRSVSVFILSLT